MVCTGQPGLYGGAGWYLPEPSVSSASRGVRCSRNTPVAYRIPLCNSGYLALTNPKESVVEAQIQLPQYQCHKKVWALEIADILFPDANSAGQYRLAFADPRYGPIAVTEEYMRKHTPRVGGYYVVYAQDGYCSFSPAKEFEAGYTRI